MKHHMQQYHVHWDTQSRSSAESMPFGGHSIGGNVWVEGGDIYFYLAQSGWFDENDSLLKAGRFRIHISPDPFAERFSQELCPELGRILIFGSGFCAELWSEINAPVVHLQIEAEHTCTITAEYQSWRVDERVVDHLSYELFQCKEVFFYPHSDVRFHKDQITPQESGIWFYHQNDDDDLSRDKTLRDQGLAAYQNQIRNPQRERIMGGYADFSPLKFFGTVQGNYANTPYHSFVYRSEEPLTRLHISVCLSTDQPTELKSWMEHVTRMQTSGELHAKKQEAQTWWTKYFSQSYIMVDPDAPNSEMWKIGRNYNLFRFMLGLNAKGIWPTKFNGGLLTFDPGLSGKSPWSDDPLHYTPDFRLWGGGCHTIQNQRLLYWPMLRCGDFDMMRQHFDLFLNNLPAARANVRAHLSCCGAFFSEQVGPYGLCCGCDNEWGNQTGLPTAQIRYHFSNSLETALMMLDYAAYTNTSAVRFLDFIDAVLTFYDTFYQENDNSGRMILYPANALETYHVVKNPIDAVAGLHTVLTRLLALPEAEVRPAQRQFWLRLLKRLPPLPMTEKNGVQILAAAETTAPIHNCEFPELYAVHPYGIYRLGKPDLELAVRTARLAAQTEEQLSHISWHPTGIQYAYLGMVDEAWAFIRKKLGDGPFRFPAFWGPGHDWTPDHNWGGSGMLQLQEMLLQTDGRVIRLLPCWPRNADVSFKLYAPYQTVVECCYKNGTITHLHVTPEARLQDIIYPDI